MTAPERIWIAAYDADDDAPLWELISEHAASPDDGDVEYIRADLCRAPTQAADAALERAAQYCETHAVQSVFPSAAPTPIGDACWSHVGQKYAAAIRALKSAPAPTTLQAALAVPEVRALVGAATSMRDAVEGIQGAMEHGTWRDENGMRLKDTKAWVELYNALAALRA